MPGERRDVDLHTSGLGRTRPLREWHLGRRCLEIDAGSVLPHHHRRDAHREEILERFLERIAVRVQVDEARRERAPVGIDHTRSRHVRAHLRIDRCDRVALDQDVRAIGGCAGAVDDGGVADQQIVVTRTRLRAGCKDDARRRQRVLLGRVLLFGACRRQS